MPPGWGLCFVGQGQTGFDKPCAARARRLNVAAMSQNIRIASWNINSVRARPDLVERFLTESAPDILCLQETKVEDGLFPEGMFRQLGYNHIVINGQKAYHGVATVSRVPIHQRQVFDWQANGEARHVAATLENGVAVHNVYIPAGGEIPDREENLKFGQKLDFLGRMVEWSSGIRDKTIITGDFNVAPLEQDVWSSKQLRKVVSHTPIERELLETLKNSADWVDLAREFVDPDTPLFTWWSYRANARNNNKGWRLDYGMVAEPLRDRLKRSVILSEAKHSDHCPILVEIDG